MPPANRMRPASDARFVGMLGPRKFILISTRAQSIKWSRSTSRLWRIARGACPRCCRRWLYIYTAALPGFVALARAFGWAAKRVEDLAELAQALEECLQSMQVFFLDVRVKASENCFPMIPAGAGHLQIQLSGDRWYQATEA